MSIAHNRSRSSSSPEMGRVSRVSLAAVVLGIVIAVASGWYISEIGITYKEVVVVLLAAGGAVIVLAGERGLMVGLVIWVLTLGLGYRTLQLTPHIKLHPAELLLVVLFALLVVIRLILGREEMSFWLPRWVLLLLPFLLWGWVPGLLANHPWDFLFSEFRNFLLVVPVFVVVANVARSEVQTYALLVAFYVTGTYIAGLGLLEYLFPGIARLLPGFISNPAAYVAVDGFQRAAFSFYGHPNAVFVCAFSLPFGLFLAGQARETWKKIVVAGALLLQISGVFVAGFRSMWLQSAVLVTLIFIRFLGFVRGLAVVVVLGFVTFPLAPDAVEQRIDSLVKTLQGRPEDSSGQKRWARAGEAAKVTIENPLGQGWGGTGWVHSDFIQVAGNLGIAAGLLFLGAYLVSLRRLWQALVFDRQGERDELFTFALFLSFLTVGWVLATEPMIVLPQTVLPVWLVWVLVELELRKGPLLAQGSGSAL